MFSPKSTENCALSGIPRVLLQAAAAAVFFLAMRTLFETAFQKLDSRKAAAPKGDGRLTVPGKTISP